MATKGSHKPQEGESYQLRDDWDPSQSAFQDEDGRFERHVERTETKNLDPSQLRKEQRMQNLGKQIVSNMYMLVRNVKLHAPDNAIFLKPIEALRESMNNVIALDNELNLNAASANIYLNNHQLKFDFSSLENVTYLTKEFEKRDIGGFATNRPVTSQEIRDFLYIFSRNFQGDVKEDGVDGKQMQSLRLKKFSYVKELLDKLQASQADLNEQVDRKKYLMTVYARTVLFMKKYFEKIAKEDFSMPFAKAGRLIQELVDLCYDQKQHFLGVTTTKSATEYLPHHSVNTALLSIVFGAELGLDKRQLHDLGMAALFVQMGLVGMPDEILLKKGSLTPAERRVIDLYPLRSAKRILKTRGLDQTTMMRIVATYESKVDYAIPRKLADGEIELVMPKMGLGTYGKVIAICDCYDALTSQRPFRDAYGPEIALALMTSQIKYKFDPALLRVFMKVMAIQPIKILGKGESTLRIA